MFKRKVKIITPIEKVISDIKSIMFDCYFPDLILDYFVNMEDDKIITVIVYVDGRRYGSNDSFYLHYIKEMELAMSRAYTSYVNICIENKETPYEISYNVQKVDSFISHIELKNITTQTIKWKDIYGSDDVTVLVPVVN